MGVKRVTNWIVKHWPTIAWFLSMSLIAVAFFQLQHLTNHVNGLLEKNTLTVNGIHNELVQSCFTAGLPVRDATARNLEATNKILQDTIESYENNNFSALLPKLTAEEINKLLENRVKQTKRQLKLNEETVHRLDGIPSCIERFGVSELPR